jgi:hypothetical protein
VRGGLSMLIQSEGFAGRFWLYCGMRVLLEILYFEVYLGLKRLDV